MHKKNKRPAWERQSPYWRIDAKPLSKSNSGHAEGEGWFGRGYLPHFHKGFLFQHVTFHLADSLPLPAIRKIQWSLRRKPDHIKEVLIRKRLHGYLDAGRGSCVLRNQEVAQMMEETLLFFHGCRYEMHHWVIMPNHVHVLFRVIEPWHLGKIVASWKRWSAGQINKYLAGANKEIGAPNRAVTPRLGLPKNGKGTYCIWQREYFDRLIRSEEHYRKTVNYIWRNPVKAGLCRDPREWAWGSARYSHVDYLWG